MYDGFKIKDSLHADNEMILFIERRSIKITIAVILNSNVTTL